MSAADPSATLASFSPVEGSAVSKYFPVEGAAHAPLMKCPKRRLWWSSHASASFASSGAGPYSIVTNFSAMLIFSYVFFRPQHPEILCMRHESCDEDPSGRDVASYVSTSHAKRWDGDNPPNSGRSRDA